MPNKFYFPLDAPIFFLLAPSIFNFNWRLQFSTAESGAEEEAGFTIGFSCFPQKLTTSSFSLILICCLSV
jgi:hypothetical protein